MKLKDSYLKPCLMIVNIVTNGPSRVRWIYNILDNRGNISLDNKARHLIYNCWRILTENDLHISKKSKMNKFYETDPRKSYFCKIKTKRGLMI